MVRRTFAWISGAAVLLALGAPASAEDWASTYHAQRKLAALGYEIKPDGRSGPATRKALTEAGEKHGFEPTVIGLFKHFAAEAVGHSTPVDGQAQMAAIEAAVKDDLMDPFSAQLRNVVRQESGIICGQVNAKNRFGAYVGWRTFMIPLVVPLPKPSDEWYASGAMIDGPDDDYADITCMLDIGPRLTADEQREMDEYMRANQ